ncbi:hypothetical protein ACFVYT_04605 [Streptomyces sp. NPDC058290]|uniref:hypothetical protein n=1 Tax=Streptomyces sp. NPDC058290 TaxID=3346426 RepID=UPI0036E264D7
MAGVRTGAGGASGRGTLAEGILDAAWRQALAAEDLDGIRSRAELQAPDAASRLRAWLAAGAGGR